jgi:hypothetical protein
VLTVTLPGVPPDIVTSPVLTGRVGEAYSYDVDASGEPAPQYALAGAPAGMTIADKTGIVSWTPGSAGDYDVTVTAANSEGTDSQSFSISVAPAFASPSFVSSPVTDAFAGGDYRYDADATGNPTPTYTLSENPPGMSIDGTTGVVTWTVGAVGAYSISIVASNEVGNDIQSFTLTVVDAPARPTIVSSPPVQGTVGQSYSYDVDATGNPMPSYSLSTAPSGMSIDTDTGLIVWTPASTGTFNVTVRAENAQGDDSQSFAISVGEPLASPSITSNPILTATVDRVYSYNVNASGNPNPVYALATAPAGMTINVNNGVISWTPAVAGTFDVAVEATNSQGSDMQSFAVVVNPAPTPPSITSLPSTQAFVGQPYAYDAEADGVPAPTYALTNAPEGMTIDSGSGLIAWTPSSTGSFGVAVRASNSQGNASQLYTIVVNQGLAAPNFQSEPPTTATVGVSFRYNALAAGNPAPTYALTMAPEGMTIEAASGLVTWTPNASGSSDVTIEASNSQGRDEQSFLVVVGEPLAAPQIVTAPATQTIVDIPYSYDADATGNPAPTFALLTAPAGMGIDNVTGLVTWTPGITGTYNVAIQASNTQGSATQLFALRVENTSTVAVLRSQSIEIIDPTTYIFEAIVSANGSPTTVTFQYGRNAVDETSILATPQPVVGLEIPIATTVNGLAEGTTYLFRVVAENNAGKTTGPISSFTTYQSTYEISADRPFGSGLDTLSYRLFSLPGDVDINAGATLDGDQRVDWNVYRDNGQQANYFEEFNGGALFRFRPGRAFWMLGRENWSVPEQTVNTVDLGRDGTFDVRLQPGWNLIGSPFLIPIPWASVKEKNPTLPATAKLWAFNGSYSEATELSPYAGYYVFNDQDTPLTLALPFPGLYPTPGKTAGATIADADMPRALRLTASTRDRLVSAAEVYFNDEAFAGADRLDQYAPRLAFAGLSLSIEPAFDVAYGALALEARPESIEGESFDLVLQTEAGEPVALAVGGLDAFLDRRVALLDVATGRLTDLHGRPELTLHPDRKATRYQLLVGSDAFVEARRRTTVPEAFQLAPAYPNPFSQSATVEFTLPEADEVELAVYDVLGRQFEVLLHGTQPAGFHQVTWDGANAPNGMYVVRLQSAGGPTLVRTLVKTE